MTIDALNEISVTRRAETDVVREQRRTDHVVVPVNGVGAPDDGNRRRPTGRVHRRVVESIGELHPIGDRCLFVVAGERAAAVEDGPEAILAHILGCHIANFRLHHLPDLLFERHAREQLGDVLFHRCVRRHRARHLRPLHA
jgi:hypothetical protein